MKKSIDYKFTGGMLLLLAVFAVIAGGFWSTVAKQAQMIKEEEQQQEAQALTAVFVETGEAFKHQVFVDVETNMIFTAQIPPQGIYNKNGKLVSGEVPEDGDIIKIYGDGVMGTSDPAVYGGVTKMQRIGRTSLEESDKYKKLVEEAFGGTMDK